MLSDAGEPESFQEARECANKDRWWEAMQEEMESLHKNHTFELVQLPKGKNEEQMGVQVEAGKQELTTTLQGEG